MKLNLPPWHDALLFSISGTGSFICPVAHTRLDIPRPVITHAVMDNWGSVKGIRAPSVGGHQGIGIIRRPTFS